MKKNLSVKNKVEAALASIENIERATPSPWFYTNLIAKINHAHTTIWERLCALILQPRIAFATIFFIIIINAAVLYSGSSGNVSSPELTESTSSEEYTLASTSLYDLEIDKP